MYKDYVFQNCISKTLWNIDINKNLNKVINYNGLFKGDHIFSFKCKASDSNLCYFKVSVAIFNSSNAYKNFRDIINR